MPPQWVSISSRKLMPISSSTTHGLFTWPLTWNSLVPLLFSRPKDENHVASRRRIVGTTAILSTLLTVVGQPQTPAHAGNDGFKSGCPFLPTRLSITPVYSTPTTPPRP